jgi:hypothetical protein
MACRGNCNQGRKDCPHPVQCEQGLVSQALTDWGLLADEPESGADDYTSEPITSAERVVLLIIAASSVAGVALLATSCIT